MPAMHWFEPIGYVGSLLMFLTFFMKTMIPLRLTGIAANVFMIVYTAAAGVVPVLILQSCLLPLNVYRLVQMRRLIARVKAAARGDFRLDPLIPFMRREHHKKGHVLFRTGDPANRLYMIQRGTVRLAPLDKKVGKGDVLGEIGILSPHNLRTATAICDEDTDVFSIGQESVLQLFYQHPEFGFFLVRLITQRLLVNLDDANFDAMATIEGGGARPG